MPDLDGWTVLAALRGNPELADIPVVMATITDQQRKGMALGAAGYLTKPIDRDQLIALLRPFRDALQRTRVLMVEDDPAQLVKFDRYSNRNSGTSLKPTMVGWRWIFLAKKSPTSF